jgi:hypothetical protein
MACRAGSQKKFITMGFGFVIKGANSYCRKNRTMNNTEHDTFRLRALLIFGVGPAIEVLDVPVNFTNN